MKSVELVLDFEDEAKRKRGHSKDLDRFTAKSIRNYFRKDELVRIANNNNNIPLMFPLLGSRRHTIEEIVTLKPTEWLGHGHIEKITYDKIYFHFDIMDRFNVTECTEIALDRVLITNPKNTDDDLIIKHAVPVLKAIPENLTNLWVVCDNKDMVTRI